MAYYLPHTLILPVTIVRRERRLPPGAFPEGAMHEGTRVTSEDVVLRGSLPSDYIVLDALKPLGLQTPADITDDMLLVKPGSSVTVGDVILSAGQGRRARTLKSPVNAVFSRLEAGQVILQAKPAPIEVRAMCPGEVRSIRNNGATVMIETIGGLIQCVWGNGQQAFCSYKLEPKEGISSLAGETLLPEYRALAMVLPKPILDTKVFDIAVQQQLAGLIAPSMHANLREIALAQKIPIILTEGFGELQMSEIVYNLLRDNVGRQTLIDATEPSRWSPDRPELVIPSSATGLSVTPPIMDQPIKEGAAVRIVRAPQLGASGRVKRVIETPRAVDNGLRLAGAEVQLTNGRTVFVPLANLEMLGRPNDGS